VTDATQQLQRLHQLSVLAGSSITGFSSVTLNDVDLTVGAAYKDGVFSVSYLSSQRVEVTTAQFHFVFSNSDNFINQAVSPLVSMSQLADTHGLLGQTHSMKRYTTPLKHIQGDVDDYVIADNSLFGHQFTFNRFDASPPA
jgi:hypothetical protein